MEPRQHFVQCLSPKGLHRIAYREWGDAANGNVLVCVHGLTRCARDFDTFARAMADRYRVICPDVAGRGHSDWLSDPMAYQIPQYVSDMVTLIARLDVEKVDWVGTSMGGLIGLALAAQPNTPVAKLVLNDAGAVVTKVSFGEADAGIVYSSDVKAGGPKVQGVEIPDQLNVVARYPISLVKGGKNVRAASAFLDFVATAKGREVLAGVGFILP